MLHNSVADRSDAGTEYLEDVHGSSKEIYLKVLFLISFSLFLIKLQVHIFFKIVGLRIDCYFKCNHFRYGVLKKRLIVAGII